MGTESPQDCIAIAREALARTQKVKDLMVAVATGGPRIEAVNHDYRTQREELRAYLDALGIADPNPFDDLWAWYGRWSSGDLPSYQSRRRFLSELFAPLLEHLRGGRGRARDCGGAPANWLDPRRSWNREDARST